MNPQTHIIRVHTAEGRVYARYMEPMDFPVPGMMAVCGPAPVPGGPAQHLDQQGVVDRFRAEGWTVEQDNGTDFDHPEWGE